MHTGELIKKFRNSQNLSMVDFAKKLNVTRCRVWQIENQNNLNTSTLNKIATAFGVDIKTVLGLDNIRNGVEFMDADNGGFRD